jgi:uncharacterized membrane protein
MVSTNTDPIIEFFRKFGPVFETFTKLDNSEWIGLIFSIILSFIIICVWYWICFKDGAQRMREGIINYNRKFGIKTENSLMVSYIFLKSIVTIVLLFSIVFLYFAIASVILK